MAESDANFIWLHLPETVEEADVVAGLRERGVLVRAGAALGRDRSLRVTVGTDAENERFADALAAGAWRSGPLWPKSTTPWQSAASGTTTPR